MKTQSPLAAPDLLKKAAIKLILERGFSGATLTPILKEAGLSKGAMFHHYESRDALMAAAYMHLLSQAMEADTAMAKSLQAGETTLENFLEKIVARYRSETFVVTMELAVAVRTRPEILKASKGFPEWQKFQSSYWQKTFELPNQGPQQTAIHWDMLGYTLRGIGLRAMFGTEQKNNTLLATAIKTEFFSEAVVKPLTD